jgi:predicted ribosome quality control (RQC) complex YloA/Tae2 family protein
VRVSDGVAAELRRASLAKALRAQSKRLARRSEAVQQDLARLDDTERLRRTGRMLLAQGAKVPRGATTAVLEDWEAGGTLEVTLDPSVPAKQQAERFFHEARRVQRGAEQMWARYEATERELEAVRALLAEVDAALELSPITLRGWGEAARALKVVVHDGVDARGRVRTTVPERLPFHAYRTEDGHKVLVGRGAADNDRLTVSVARPQDLWLHARGYPGAHVVVPLQRGEAPPPGALLDAATLAAHHSDARGQDLVEVTWTERRYVRKARKSAVGQVTVDRERVLALRLEPARLARLLASRDDG